MINMKINDNYLKEQLQHVYWLNGGCCAGKITMTKKFIEELGFQILDLYDYKGAFGLFLCHFSNLGNLSALFTPSGCFSGESSSFSQK
jgi:hypothetical protein